MAKLLSGLLAIPLRWSVTEGFGLPRFLCLLFVWFGPTYAALALRFALFDYPSEWSPDEKIFAACLVGGTAIWSVPVLIFLNKD